MRFKNLAVRSSGLVGTMSTVLLLAASGVAHAFQFCVASSADLQTALDQSADGGVHNGEDNIVMVVQNFGAAPYKTGATTAGGAFHYINSAATGSITIAGGYNADCSVRTLKAALTMLDGDHLTPVLTITSAHADINVTGLTLQNGESSLPGAGLAVNPDNAQISAVLIEENIIRNNHTTASGGGLAANSGGTDTLMFVEKNLIVGNSAEQNDGAGFLVSNAGDIHLYNNTIVENTTRAVGTTGGIQVSSGAGAHVWNNIFWNNTNNGLYAQTTHLFSVSNDFDTWFGPTAQTGEGDVSLNPLFVDATDGDFHLRGTSPLLGAGWFTTIAFDLEGHPAPNGGRMDMGAYEETIFIDAFEGF